MHLIKFLIKLTSWHLNLPLSKSTSNIIFSFSPDHGYLIESRRGGGGYIRIVRIVQSGAQQLMYLINERIGDAIGEEEASRLVQQLTEQKLVTAQEAALMRAAMSAQALAIPIPDSMKDAQRARIFKAMLTSIARQNRTMP